LRLAYFSPLNPAPSGISDYSRELLPHFAAHAEITLVTDGYAPTDPELKSFRALDDRAYDARAFDLALYHLGNSPAHAYIYRRALREPGVIVLHDLVLHHLVAWLTIQHGDTHGYVAAMREAYGDAGARLAEREVSGTAVLNRFEYPLSERVIRNARGVIAHSRYVANAVKRIAPDIPVAQIPHEMPDIPLLAQKDARAQLHLPPNAKLVGTFGNLGPAKRTTVLFNAFCAVHPQLPDARLLLVGATSPNFDAQGLADLFGLRDATQMVGHVPFDAFHTYMAAMDVCVNLRYPTAGETSGAVLRAMALAKPVLVSRAGWFAELPDDAVAKIDLDDHEVAQLSVTLARLLWDEPLRAAMGANARRYVLENCAVQAAARRYAEFLLAVVEGRDWGPETGDWGAENSNRQARVDGITAEDGRPTARNEKPEARAETRESQDAKQNQKAKSINHPSEIVPHLPAPVAFTDWRDTVARAYVDLGLAADDAVLENVARAAIDLGLGEK
jgi:glycosyltransferase involved in cell wall biosynthesis